MLVPSRETSPPSISPVDRNTRDFKRMARKAWELWGSWSSDVGQTLDQAAGSSPGRQRPSGARTVRAVTNRRLGWCSQVLTQRWDSLEGPRRAEVQTRQEGRLCDKREQSSRHGAHPSRPSCHILPGDGRLAVRLVPATMRRGLCCKPAVWSRMPVLPSITPPVTPGMHLGPRTRHHPQAAPGHPPGRQEGPLRSRCDWPPSSSEPITLREPVPPVPCLAPFRLSPPYRAVSQGNWLVNSVKPPSPCATP